MTPLFKIGNLEDFFEEEQWHNGIENLTLARQDRPGGFSEQPTTLERAW